MASDPNSRPGLATQMMALMLAGPLTAMLSIIFGISFAAIVYSGPMSPFLSQGIGLTLLGASMMAPLGAFLFSFRGTITQPQDITAILLSIAAGNIAAATVVNQPETAFATVAMLVVIATFFTGITAYGFGRFGLGFIARFIPYPVLAGFLAATGYLLMMGAIGMLLGTSVDFWTLPDLFQGETLMRWLPWMAVTVAVVVLARLIKNPLTLPMLLITVALGFYGLLFITGTSLEAAREAGMLLGPFEERTFLHGLSPALVFDVDWRLITREVPTIIAVIAMTIIGTLLNATALGVELDRDVDLDRDLKAVGLTNLVSSGGGGLVGYHLLAETLLARRLGLSGAMPGLFAGMGTLLALVFGAGLMSALPIGLFAVVIGYLGVDLLYTWLWALRRNLPSQDYGLVMMILMVAATIGFLQSLTIGLLAAAMLFIYSYARIDTVRLRSSLATRRSSVERGVAQQTILAEDGLGVQITELTGYLFFGTANGLADQLQADLKSGQCPNQLIIDFTRVPELDASAAFALEKIAKTCARSNVALWCSGVGKERQSRFPLARLEALGVVLFKTLDEALQAAENAILEKHPQTGTSASFLDILQRKHPDIRLDQVFERTELEAGEVLVEQGAQSAEMFVLISGALAAEVTGLDGVPVPVSRFLPGALLGEIAYYASVPRTAAIRAVEPSVVVRLDSRALDGGGPAAALAEDVHREAAGFLAKRLIRTTQMLRAGGF